MLYSDDHATCWGCQDAGAISARPRMTATPDAMPHSVLPIVLGYCTPRFMERDADFHNP